MQLILVCSLCVLQFYWICLVVLAVFVGLFGIFFNICNIMSSANRNHFTSFPIWIVFVSFFCLIVLAKTSSSMLNRSGDSGHICLVPDHRGKCNLS